jgi:hypothetical protein
MSIDKVIGPSAPPPATLWGYPVRLTIRVEGVLLDITDCIDYADTRPGRVTIDAGRVLTLIERMRVAAQTFPHSSPTTPDRST